MKKYNDYKKGGSLKKVPAGKKFNGLRALATNIRNKMGYKRTGGESGLYKMTYGGSSMDMTDYGMFRKGGAMGKACYTPKNLKRK